MNSRVKIGTLLVILLSGIVVGDLVYFVGNVTFKAETNGSLVYINGERGSVSVSLEDSDNDGFSDSGSVLIRNEGDFSFNGRVANLAVRHEDENYLVILAGNGIWYFYSDEDSDGAISENDIKIGKIKIEQGSSALEGDSFTVASNGEKELNIKIYFEPYASQGIYEVSFDVLAIYEKGQ
jgi:hypothetical protein